MIENKFNNKIFRKNIYYKIAAISILIIFIGVGINPIFGANILKKENNSKIYSHIANKEDIELLKKQVGIYDSKKEYNEIYDGFGTGLTPPTEEEWEAMIGNILIIDTVGSNNGPGASFDMSTDPRFPQVRSQGSQGSCAAWAATYYTTGYLQAKNNGWNEASIGNNNHLLSPAFTYNKYNYGHDGGSHTWTNGYVMRSVGVCRWVNMPYNQYDDVGWGNEDAWRDAPKYRIDNVYTLSSPFDNTDINTIKNTVSGGTPVTFALHASSYNNFGSDDVLGTTGMVNNYNHANTIVGYDDSVTDSETGETGAFKVVNSWGSGWGPNSNGYYWMTYDAFKGSQNTYPACWFDILYESDEPTLLGVWNLNPVVDRDASVELGVGSYASPLETRNPLWDGHSDVMHSYPSFMCLDITEFYDEWAGGNDDFYLEIGNAAGNDGTITSFKIEYYASGYTPGNPTYTTSESSDVPENTPGYVTNILDTTPGPQLAYDPTSHDFGGVLIDTTISTDFEIWNSGGDTLTYTLSESCDWLTLSTTSGTSNGEHDTITINIDTNGLTTGGYNYDISINSDGGDGTFNVQVNVVLTGETLDQQQTQHSMNYNVYGARWTAQSFIPSFDTLTKIEVYVGRTGVPADGLTVAIRSSLTGLDLESMTVDKYAVPTASDWFEFDLDDLTLTPGGTYYIVLRASSGSSSKYYRWGLGMMTSYSNGMFHSSTNGGSSWSNYGSFDAAFKTYGKPAAPPVYYSLTVSTVGSGSVVKDPDEVQYEVLIIGLVIYLVLLIRFRLLWMAISLLLLISW